MLLCIFANTKQSRPLNLLCNNEIMPTHENSFHINEGKNTTQVAYKVLLGNNLWELETCLTFSHSWFSFFIIGFGLLFLFLWMLLCIGYKSHIILHDDYYIPAPYWRVNCCNFPWNQRKWILWHHTSFTKWKNRVENW